MSRTRTYEVKLSVRARERCRSSGPSKKAGWAIFSRSSARILETYNPGSAYVDLESWDGTSCVACGYSMSRNEGTRCSISGDDVCDDCSVFCPDCENDFSPDYTDRCNRCGEDYCQHCLEEGRCHDCWEKIREEELEAEEREAETPLGGCGGNPPVLEEAEALGPGVE